MGIGSDKIISYDPPGAIGLVDRDAVVLIRFDEVADSDHPADSTGNLNDLGITTGLAQPVVVPAAVGRGRQFNAGITSGFVTTDRVPGSTLLTRDMTVQMIVSFNMANQIAYGTPAQIVKRGKGTSWGANERESFAINASHVAVPAGDCDLHWEWETVAGALKVQAGVVFTPPPAGKFTLITLTRRWVSPTSVILRHYVGDTLLGEVLSTDGDIGGSILGTTGIGSVGQAGGVGYGRTFALGIIDELMILGRELCAEEIEATWLRITRYQPLGVQLFLENHDDGFPMPIDPASDFQLDTRMIGQTFGYAAAAAENLRANFLPGRAYGTTLDQWEELTLATQQHADHRDDDLDTRRARVLGRMRQRRGVSIPGIGDALQGLIGAATLSDLEYIAFSNQWQDDFNAIDLLRWDVRTLAPTATAGKARWSPSAAAFDMNGYEGWLALAANVGHQSHDTIFGGEHALAKLTLTTPQDGIEVGIWFGNRITGDYLVLGLNRFGGVYKVLYQQFLAHVPQASVVITTLGGNPANLWLHLYQEGSTWIASYSITSRTTGYVLSAPITHPGLVYWSGIYLRSTGVAGAVVDFDDFTLYTPNGGAPTNAYVLLDQALGFSPDTLGAQSVIRAIKHAFVHGTFITRPAFLCDDAQSGCDLGPLGGY